MQELEMLEPLLEGLRDGDWEVRQEAGRRLKELHEESSLPRLVEVAQDPDMDVRLAVVEALANFQQKESEEALLEALFDEEWEIKWAALRSLGTQWSEADLRKMGDKLPEKRIAGVEAIEKRYDRRFLKPLLALLDDEEEVQAAGIRALTQLGDPEAVGPLKELRGEVSEELQALIEEALVRLGDLETIRAHPEDRGPQLSCEVCHQPLPLSFLKKVGSWKYEGSKLLCQFHFEENTEQIEPFEGKLKACKQCKTYWPKVQVLEGSCPPCRKKRYLSLNAAGDGQFRCFVCQKLRYERDRSPIESEGNPLCGKCAYQLSQQSANSPYLISAAIEFLQDAFEEGFLLCEKCKNFHTLSEIVEGEDFRDACLCESCAGRGR